MLCVLSNVRLCDIVYDGVDGGVSGGEDIDKVNQLILFTTENDVRKFLVRDRWTDRQIFVLLELLLSQLKMKCVGKNY